VNAFKVFSLHGRTTNTDSVLIAYVVRLFGSQLTGNVYESSRQHRSCQIRNNRELELVELMVNEQSWHSSAKQCPIVGSEESVELNREVSLHDVQPTIDLL
jgi:hypothetical protein